MTGASLALIIIPFASTVGLVLWLIMVFSADGRIGQADRSPAVTQASTRANAAERLPTAAAAASRRIEAAASGATAGQFRRAA